MLGRTVGELLDTVSYPELQQWAEFFEVNPDPEWRADARSAQVCATLANINRDDKKRPQPYEVKDFMLAFDRAKKAKREEKKQEDGAKIAPETVTWLFAMARKGKRK